MARRATVIERQRQASRNILVLDAGNCLVGDRDPARRTKGQTSIEVMNRMGYDAAALGGKDLELEPEVLKQRIAEAGFPLLSANAVDAATGSRLADPFTVITFERHRVGIVGISGPPASDAIQVRDPFHAAEVAVAQLAGDTDIIIVLSNAGETVNQAIASQIPGVDLVIGAAGKATPRSVQTEGAMLVQADQASPGHAGRFVGVAQLQFDSQGNMTESRWQRVRLSPDIPDDAEFVTWVNQHR
ncbi:MAG: hypothetical protein ACE5F6_02545 [Anaerolineae bacterium]